MGQRADIRAVQPSEPPRDWTSWSSGSRFRRGASQALRACGRALGPRMVPSFLVIGAKRSGTTSLYEYLRQHPDVFGGLVPKGTHYFDVNFSRGWDWYLANFPPEFAARVARRRRRHQPVTGEASPYYLFHPMAPPRIAAALPDVRLIAVLRDPIERAYSHYQYELARGAEHLAPEDAFDREDGRLAGEAERMAAEPGYESFEHRHHSYLARGRYAEQLEALYAHVAPERVLVLQSEALFADPDAAMQAVHRFLGCRSVPVRDARPFKALGAGDAVPPSLRVSLERHFREPNERLYAMPGIEFRWPSGRDGVARRSGAHRPLASDSGTRSP